MQPVCSEQTHAGAECLIEIGHAAKPQRRSQTTDRVVQIVDRSL